MNQCLVEFGINTGGKIRANFIATTGSTIGLDTRLCHRLGSALTLMLEHMWNWGSSCTETGSRIELRFNFGLGRYEDSTQVESWVVAEVRVKSRSLEKHSRSLG